MIFRKVKRIESHGTSADVEAIPAGARPELGQVILSSDEPAIYLGRGENEPLAKISSSGAVSAAATQQPPDGYLHFTSIATSDISVFVRHNGADGATGICWSANGSAPVYTAVAANASVTITIPHNGGALMDVHVWPATSHVSGRVGDLSSAGVSNASVISANIQSLSALASASFGNNQLRDFTATGLANLTSLTLVGNSIENVTLRDLPSIQTLDVGNNKLTRLNVDGFTSLTQLAAYQNDLVSVSASGVKLSFYSSSLGLGSQLHDNNLSAAALDAFYESLDVDDTNYGQINVANNPGTSADDPTIATAKGYTIVGT